MRIRLALTALCALLAACGTAPSRVVNPELATFEDKKTLAQRMDAYKAELAKYQGFSGVWPVERTKDLVEAQINLYAATWRKAANALRLRGDVTDIGQVGGALAGAYHIVKENLKLAKHAAAGVALLGMDDKTFAISVQAVHYTQAADAMLCVRDKVAEVPPSAWRVFKAVDANTPDGTQAAGEVDPAYVSDKTEEMVAALNDTFPSLNRSMGAIADKLRAKQESQQLSLASPAAIADSLRASAKAVETAQASGAGFKTQNLLTSSAQSPVSEAAIKALLAMPVKVRAECVDPFIK